MSIRESTGPTSSIALPGLTLGAVLMLAGCAHTAAERRQQSTLADLQKALPGVYTSVGPSGASGAAAADSPDTADQGVTLTVSPVTSQLIGDVVYFVRETPAGNSNLVLWEGLWTLIGETPKSHGHGEAHDGEAHDKDGGARVVEHGFLFKEPRRWTSAATDPDLLVSLLPQDLQVLTGCDLVWRKTEAGFEANSTLAACHPGSKAAGLWIEEHARLEGTELYIDERLVEPSGALDRRGVPQSLHLTRTG